MPKEKRKYFSHDYDTLEDRDIVPLIMKYKSSGYGVFWATVEMMHKYQERGEYLPFDNYTFLLIARNVHEDVSLIKEIITDCVKKFKLLELKNKRLQSKRVDENILYYKKSIEQKSAAGKASGQSRRGKKNERPFNDRSTTVQRPFNDRSTTVEQTVNRTEQTVNRNEQSQSQSQIDYKDSNSLNNPTKIPVNSSQSEISEAAKAAFDNCGINLPKWFIDEQAKKLSVKYFGKKINHLKNLVAKWLSNFEKENGYPIPEIITINGKKHEPTINGSGVYYKTIKTVDVDKKKKEVILADGSRIKLKGGDLTALEKGILMEDKFFKGMKY